MRAVKKVRSESQEEIAQFKTFFKPSDLTNKMTVNVDFYSQEAAGKLTMKTIEIEIWKRHAKVCIQFYQLKDDINNFIDVESIIWKAIDKNSMYEMSVILDFIFRELKGNLLRAGDWSKT